MFKALVVFAALIAVTPFAQASNRFGKGTIQVDEFANDEVSVLIEGPAAQAIYENLSASLEESPVAPLTSFTKKGKHVQCKYWPSRPKYSCYYNLNSDGEALDFRFRAIQTMGGVGN